MNYSELTQAIQDYAQNDETSFVNNIPNFVNAAEQKIYRAARIPDTRSLSSSVTISASTPTFTLPTGFLLPLYFKIRSGTTDYPVLLKDESYITQAFPDSTYEARPVVYAIRNDTTGVVGPVPDTGYTGILGYLAFPESIVTAGTTWLGTYAESCLLYGSMIQAYIYMKGEQDVMAMYKEEFAAELELLMAEVGAIKYDEYIGNTVV